MADPLSLEAAVDRAREDASITELVLRGGVYEVRSSLDLGKLVRPSGQRLLLRAESDTAEVVLRGGRSLAGAWRRPKSGDPLLAALPGPARSAVWMASLPELGITDYGQLRERGFINRQRAPGELFVAGRRQPLAGYPNPGETRGDRGEAFGVEEGFQRYAEGADGSVLLSDELAARLAVANGRDAWAHGYWGVNWADAHLPVKGVDPETQRLTLGGSPFLGIQNKGAFRIYNLPEELDAPGEWYLDRERGRLYFWPESEQDLGSTSFSLLETPLLVADGSSNLRFQNLVFEVGRGDLVSVRKSSLMIFSGCVFRGSGIKGLVLDGERNRVEDSLFEGLGETAVRLSGGNRTTLRPGANLITNSVFREFGEVYLTYGPAVYLAGVGNTLAHNLMTDAPHEAVQVHGNLNRVFRNEISNVCRFSDDAGAIYSGRDWLAWGNELVENYIHDIRTSRTAKDDWVHGIYLDDCANGFTIRGNIIENVDAFAINSGGGRYNVVDGNLFINARGGHLNDNRGAKWITTMPGDSWNMFEGISRIDRFAEPWKSAFPGLAQVPNDLAGAMAYVYPDGCEFTDNSGIAVPEWTYESDWIGNNSGVFAHYAAFDGAPVEARLVESGSLAEVLRRDSAIEIAGQTLPFSAMGLLESRWAAAPTTRGSALAAFTWDAAELSAGAAIRFHASTGWALPRDPVHHVQWTINGVTVGNQLETVWTPDYGSVYRVALEVVLESGARDRDEYLLAVAGPTAPDGATLVREVPVEPHARSNPASPLSDHPLWSDATLERGGWLYSPWLQGWVRVSGAEWVFHETLGWLYTGAAEPGEAWMHSADFGWIYVDRNYPWLMRGDDREWYFYIVGSENPRWFMRASDQEWLQF